MDKEKIIEMIKALGLTAEELGFEEKVKRDEEFDTIVKRFIKEMNISDDAKDYFPEKYHKMLGIEDQYKVVEVEVSRTITKTVLVAMPAEDPVCDAADYLPDLTYNLDNDYPESETDWEVQDENKITEDMSATQIREEYREEEIMNYSDFDKH